MLDVTIFLNEIYHFFKKKKNRRKQIYQLKQVDSLMNHQINKRGMIFNETSTTIEEEGAVIEGHMHALWEAVIQSSINLRLTNWFVVVITETTLK